MHKSLHGHFSKVHFTYVYIRAFIRLLFHVSFGSSIILYNIVPCLSVLLKMFKFYFVIVEIYFLNLHTERGRGREREKEREREPGTEEFCQEEKLGFTVTGFRHIYHFNKHDLRHSLTPSILGMCWSKYKPIDLGKNTEDYRYFLFFIIHVHGRSSITPTSFYVSFRLSVYLLSCPRRITVSSTLGEALCTACKVNFHWSVTTNQRKPNTQKADVAEKLPRNHSRVKHNTQLQKCVVD